MKIIFFSNSDSDLYLIIIDSFIDIWNNKSIKVDPFTFVQIRMLAYEQQQQQTRKKNQTINQPEKKKKWAKHTTDSRKQTNKQHTYTHTHTHNQFFYYKSANHFCLALY